MNYLYPLKKIVIGSGVSVGGIITIVKKTRKVFVAALYGDLVFAFLSISFGTAEKKKQSPY